jgi:hypothetical protein
MNNIKSSRYSGSINFKNHKSRSSIKNLILIFLLISIINFNHNWNVSTESNSRTFQYTAWQSLTKESALFDQVKNGDVFVSNYQNDAYETNAGSFYFNTGIRLAYLFNINLIYPKIYDCMLVNGCKLQNIRDQVLATFPVLTRGAFIPKRLDSSRIDDWVATKLKPGALDKSNIWAFDAFLMTPKTYFVFLVPFVEKEQGARVRIQEVKMLTVTDGLFNEFTPSLAEYCSSKLASSFDSNGFLVTEWNLSKKQLTSATELIKIPNFVDIREVVAGTC